MKLDKYTAYLDSLLEEGIPSVDCYIYKDHKQIYHHMNGFKDAKKENKITGNELYLMFSMTKVITMTAIMQLVEKGKVSLDDYVYQYLPRYKELLVMKDGKEVPAKNILTIKHLVSMQSGLDYELNRPGILRVLKEKGMQASTRELVDSFVETPLKFEPGEHFEYSLSHDVVAAIVEVVSGMRYSEYLKKNIFEPIGMVDTRFAKPINQDEERLVTQYIYNNDTHTSTPMEPTCNYQLSENYESGGAGLMSSTSDYAKFADTIACGGTTADEVQILKPETIDIMRTNLLGDVQRKDIADRMNRVGYGYGCGVQILMDPECINSPAPKGIFGWDGAAGSLIILDTVNKLSLVYTQHVRDCGYAYGCIHPTLRDLLYEE